MQVQCGREWAWSRLNFTPLQMLAVSATYLLMKDEACWGDGRLLGGMKWVGGEMEFDLNSNLTPDAALPRDPRLLCHLGQGRAGTGSRRGP